MTETNKAALAPAEKADDDECGCTCGRHPDIDYKDVVAKAGGPTRMPCKFCRELAATPTPPSADVVAQIMAAIAPCKGEQYKFEEWAKSRHYDMSEHPLHYIFLEPKTNGARNGWKAAMEYVERIIQSAAHGGGTEGNVEVVSVSKETAMRMRGMSSSDPAQEPEAVALKPCPFCGGEAGYEESFGSPTIRCIADHCYVRPIFRCFASKDEVIQQWNTRPVSLDREALIRWAQSKDPANIGPMTGEKWADEIIYLIEGRA